MLNWPIKGTDAIDARDNILHTHRPIPLPAYNVSGELIQPDRCRKELVGSIARITFTLKHWYIDNRKRENEQKNVFVADVQSIRILVEPPQSVTSPKKRKTARRDPGVRGSSSKFPAIRIWKVSLLYAMALTYTHPSTVMAQMTCIIYVDQYLYVVVIVIDEII